MDNLASKTKKELTELAQSIGITVTGTGVNNAILKNDLVQALTLYYEDGWDEEEVCLTTDNTTTFQPEQSDILAPVEAEPIPEDAVLVELVGAAWVSIRSAFTGKFYKGQPEYVSLRIWRTELKPTGLFERK